MSAAAAKRPHAFDQHDVVADTQSYWLVYPYCLRHSFWTENGGHTMYIEQENEGDVSRLGFPSSRKTEVRQ